VIEEVKKSENTIAKKQSQKNAKSEQLRLELASRGINKSRKVRLLLTI
jgi:hypothetical protein